MSDRAQVGEKFEQAARAAVRDLTRNSLMPAFDAHVSQATERVVGAYADLAQRMTALEKLYAADIAYDAAQLNAHHERRGALAELAQLDAQERGAGGGA